MCGSIEYSGPTSVECRLNGVVKQGATPHTHRDTTNVPWVDDSLQNQRQ